MILLGSIVNGGAVVVGGLVGMFVGKLLPERLRTSVMAALSLMTIGIAVPGLLKSNNALIPIISMVVGTLIGELLDIDSAVNKLGEKLQKRFSGSRVTEGFVTGLHVFAVGALAVMGPLESRAAAPARPAVFQVGHRRRGVHRVCFHHGTGRGAVRHNGVRGGGLHRPAGFGGGTLSGRGGGQ